jgi:2-polyprenyl-3-methyl-5-hydroxy-6-metoxy-1,4-benzoquinol methylase
MMSVLDVGFWGQGVNIDNPSWVHNLLKKQGAKVFGLDIDFDTSRFSGERYIKASAENFTSPTPFSLIFAGDLIEHLSNPGLFLDSSYKNLTQDGRLIVTTPNAFNLYNLTEKAHKK